MKKILFLIITFYIFFSSQPVFASYTLPYPGVMPGNKLYPVYELFDNLKKVISFGDFAQFSYSLSQADKYLVEAKVLFEYEQFPLALRSLEKSNDYIIRTKKSLANAKKNGKNISEKEKLFKSALAKHEKVLIFLLSTLPETYTWTDEKMPPQDLKLQNKVGEALKVRNQYD